MIREQKFFPENPEILLKTLIESIPVLQSEIDQAPPQTCIKVTVQVIINAPVQKTVLCQLGWWSLMILKGHYEIFTHHDPCSKS